MAGINLLPWRAERRKQREHQFYSQLLVAGLLAVLVIIVWVSSMGVRINTQNDRNDYLRAQIKQVDAQIAKIRDIGKKRSQLLARKRIIEQLQSNRSQMVHVFDQLVKTIPDNVRLTEMKQNGEHLHLEGVAQSNASVAGYMRNLAASPWLGAPTLTKTVNRHDGSSTPYTFGLNLTLAKLTQKQIQAADAAEEAKAAQAPAAAASAPALPAASTSTTKAPSTSATEPPSTSATEPPGHGGRS